MIYLNLKLQSARTYQCRAACDVHSIAARPRSLEFLLITIYKNIITLEISMYNWRIMAIEAKITCDMHRGKYCQIVGLHRLNY